MLNLIITLAIIGVVVWLVVTYVPMPQPFKTAIILIVAISIAVYLLRVFGVADIPVPQIN